MMNMREHWMFRGMVHRDGTRSEPHENSSFRMGKNTPLPNEAGDLSSHAEFRCISRSDRESATPSWFGVIVISALSICGHFKVVVLVAVAAHFPGKRLVPALAAALLAAVSLADQDTLADTLTRVGQADMAACLADTRSA